MKLSKHLYKNRGTMKVRATSEYKDNKLVSEKRVIEQFHEGIKTYFILFYLS